MTVHPETGVNNTSIHQPQTTDQFRATREKDTDSIDLDTYLANLNKPKQSFNIPQPPSSNPGSQQGPGQQGPEATKTEAVTTEDLKIAKDARENIAEIITDGLDFSTYAAATRLFPHLEKEDLKELKKRPESERKKLVAAWMQLLPKGWKTSPKGKAFADILLIYGNNFYTLYDVNKLKKCNNELVEENEKLKQKFKTLQEQHSKLETEHLSKKFDQKPGGEDAAK